MGNEGAPQTVTVWRVKPEWSGEKLATRYRAGESLRALAVDVGLSYGSVHRRLLEHGVTFRERGGWQRGPRSAP